MMQKINKYLAIISVITFVGCSNSGLKEKFNFSHKGPDEFTVLSYKPLSVPPDFNLPDPDMNKSATNNDAYQAESVIFNRNFEDQYEVNKQILPSTGEELLLKRAGENITNGDIRALLSQENLETEKEPKKAGFFSFFSKKKAHAKDIVENPEANKSERVYKSRSAEILRKEDLHKTKKQVCDIKKGVVTNCEGNTISKEFSIEIPTKHSNFIK